MPSITFTAPDGTSTTGQMSDDDYSKFQGLPADQQASTLNSFAEQHAATATANDSYTNDLKAGVGGAMQDLGGLAQGVGLTSAGNWLRANAPTPDANYTGRGGSFLPDLKAGQFTQAAGDLSHGLASGSTESALEAGGALGGAALGSVIGPEGTAAGAVGGGLGAGAIGGALGLGRHARLAAAGRAVTGSDLANAAPAAAVDAGISGLTMGRVPGGTLGRAAAQGVGGAAQSASDQAFDTGTVDPNQVANAAASGAAFGAVTGAGSDVKSAVGRGVDRIQSSGEQYQPTDATQMQSAIRTRDALLQSQKDSSGTPGAATDLNQVANNLKSAWINDSQDRIAQMRDQGADQAALRDAQDLLNRAQRHNNRLYTGDLDVLDQANHGLDEGQLQDLKDRLTDVNTLSTNSFKNKNVGPLQALGSKVGGLATTAGLVAAGHPVGALENLVMGNAMENKLGGQIGSIGDRMLGLQKPGIVLAGQAADRMNNGAPVAQVNPITATDPNYVSPSAAQARLKAAQQAQATQASKASALRQQVVQQGQQSIPQAPVSKPLPAPPIQKAAQPLVSVPLAPPPIQRAVAPPASVPLAAPPIQRAAQPAASVPLAPPPIQRAAQPAASVPLAPPPIQRAAQPPPAVIPTPPPIRPAQPQFPPAVIPTPPPIKPVIDPRLAGLMEAMGDPAATGLTDVHSRPLASPDSYNAARAAYEANVRQWAQEAEQDHPGLGASVYAIAAAHDTSSTPPSADPATRDANRAAAKARTKQLKTNEAISQSSLYQGASDATILKHLMRPALLNHG